MWLPALIGGGIGYAITLAVLLPAALLDHVLASASNGGVRLAEARGTLWSGSGRIELRDPERRSAVGLDADWRWRPLWQAPGRLLFEFPAATDFKPVGVILAWKKLEIETLELVLPAAALGLALPRIAVLRPAGEIRIEGARLVVADGEVTGAGRVLWSNAGFAMTALWPVGSYAVRLENDARGGHAEVATAAGPLRIDGKLSWTKGAAPQGQLDAYLPAPERAQLAPLLGLIGVDRGGGAYSIGVR